MENSGKGKKGAERYLTYLTDEGFRPPITNNGNVAFKCEGRTYFIYIGEDDEEFFFLVYPNFWPIKNNEQLSRVQAAALAVIADTKVVKIFPVDDANTWATIEMFRYPPETFQKAFNRCLYALRCGVEKFMAKMQEPAKPDDAFVFHLPKYTVGEN
jgi:hypothetical protein